MTTARLLTPPTNYAVVQLPEREYPGVVFQGDSLCNLIDDLEAAISETDPVQKEGAFNEVMEGLYAVRAHYEAVLRESGISLPY
jgi:hypothetical protein